MIINLNKPGEGHPGSHACIAYLNNEEEQKNKDDPEDDPVIHVGGLGIGGFGERRRVLRGDWDPQHREGGKSDKDEKQDQ